MGKCMTEGECRNPCWCKWQGECWRDAVNQKEAPTDTLKTVQALVLADALPTIVFGELAQGTLNAAAAELRRQHALIAQMQRDAVQPGWKLPEPRNIEDLRRVDSTYFRGLGWNECIEAVRRLNAPHPEAQALDGQRSDSTLSESQLQQPAADSTRASGVCATTTPLPCPFCGGEAITGEFDVECDNPFCEVQPSACGQSLAEAVAGWNRRSAAGAQQQDDHAGSPAPSEPEYWQWRKKGEPWSLERTFNSQVHTTTPDSEVRGLYTHPAPSAQSSKAALSDDEIHRIWMETPERPTLAEEVLAFGHTLLGRAGITRRPLTDDEIDEAWADARKHAAGHGAVRRTFARNISAILARSGFAKELQA